MSTLTLSFVVPIYRIERIREQFDTFIQSLLTQTYPHTEIILINDASPDNSADILQDLADQHSHIRILTHSHNQGQGAARNTGAAAATGDYIWFVDQDDLVTPNACQILTDKIQALNYPDLVCFAAYFLDRFEDSDIELPSAQASPPFWHIDYKDYSKSKQHRIDIDYFLLTHYGRTNASWFHVIKTDLARSYQFPSFSHEDAVHTFAMLMRADSLAHVFARLYAWRQHDLNTHKTRDFDESVAGYIKAFRAKEEIAQQFASRQALQRYAMLINAHQRTLCIKEAFRIARLRYPSKDLKVDIVKRLRPKTWRAKLRFVRDTAYYHLYLEHCTLLNSWRKPKLSRYTYCYRMARTFIYVAIVKIPSLILLSFSPPAFCKLQLVYARFRKTVGLNP